MICGGCGTTTDTSPCTGCGADALLDGRYRLDAVLGQGGAGVTYRATRVRDGLVVCVKELTFHRLQSFEAERLFRREAGVLRQLHHPQIPAYLDDFTAGAGKQLALYLVQELVIGQSLTAELEGHRYTEREVLALLDELLGVLSYLHGLAPPVIHRDLKPSNILRRASDGRLVLVDFGAVKDTVANSVSGGPTVAGTFGFMAPEQLYGQASPASDLYATGVLGVVLLSRRDPAELVDREHSLAWRPHVHASAPTVALLDELTRRDPTERPADAEATQVLVRAALAALDRPRAHPAARAPRPSPIAAPALAPGESPATTPRADLADTPPTAWRPGQTRREAELEAEDAKRPAALRHPLRFLALYGVGIALLITFVSVISSSSSAPEPPLSEPAALAYACAGGPCAPLTEPVLAELRFGMSLAEAQAARADLAAGAVARDSGAVSLVLLEIMPDGYAGEPPHDLLTASVLVYDEPASCELAFLAPGGLARVVCEVSYAARGDASAFAERLGRSLAARYGPPTGAVSAYSGSTETRWDHGGAALSFRADAAVIAAMPSKVVMTQQALAWEEATERARTARRAQAAAAAAQRERDQRAQREAERARLKALQGGTTSP